MSKYLILLLISIICYSCNSSVKDYVKNNTVPIKNIDTSSVDYSDLEPIGDAIGNSRIVMMGEQDHGDAPTFIAKTRLVKYLHEKKGFNVLAFESDFFALTKGWDEVVKQDPIIDGFISKNIFPSWTKCDACSHLFYTYIPSTFHTPNPLQVSGFDCQIYLDYSKLNLISNLDSIFKIIIPVSNEDQKNTDSTLFYIKKLLHSETFFSDSIYNVIHQKISNARSLLVKNSEETNYWVLILDNLIALNKKYKIHRDYFASSVVRDQQMAANLNWLVKYKYPTEKIIVWAANTHVMKYADSIKHRLIFLNMGTLFAKQWERETYVLGFTSYEGTNGRITIDHKNKVVSPAINGFERWINSDYAYAFTDFKKYNKSYPYDQSKFKMKGAGNFSINTYWNKAFDGVFFIREMYPCKRL